MIRVTTGGVLKNYRSNLMNSFVTLTKSQNTVLTQRNFNSYAEDPSAATQAFKLRRSFQRLSSQASVSQSVTSKFNSAWGALNSVEQALDTSASNSALSAVLHGASDPTGSGRNSLGAELEQLAENMVQSMNVKYGDTYVFSGADGLTIPFEWDNGKLLYHGIDVNPDTSTAAGAADFAKLQAMAAETTYQDIGIGMQEDASGNLIESSTFDSALSGLNFLGYGVDADGDPKNVACIIKELGSLLSGCDADGNWADPVNDPVDYQRLMGKLETASDALKSNYTQMDTKAAFLKTNHAQLESTAATVNEQFLTIEQCDLADAITAYSWAQYCYNATLKLGTSILSESLMDYLR